MIAPHRRIPAQVCALLDTLDIGATTRICHCQSASGAGTLRRADISMRISPVAFVAIYASELQNDRLGSCTRKQRLLFYISDAINDEDVARDEETIEEVGITREWGPLLPTLLMNQRPTKMQIPITNELRLIFKQIVDEQKTEDEWSEIESDDMYQSESFDGGFDATERAFCFSYYANDGDEFWFQLTLSEIEGILGRRKTVIDGRTAG